VYIDLVIKNSHNDINHEHNKVTATIKNIASYEMNFNENEILERFVRGEKARSGEGSGLGLAIAQSFTHVCNGEFDIIIDGDMFKAILSFDIIHEQ
jgi:signal transduction histidine kinase